MSSWFRFAGSAVGQPLWGRWLFETLEATVTADLLVVGFDLRTGREVHVGERSVERWRPFGHNGDRSVVCFYCYHGFDAVAGTRIPLIARGRLGGLVRPHFAHPPGQAPEGGHHPETVWHLSAKHVLARWARALPDVTSVRLERWTPERNRRADVEVCLSDGTVVALEAQRAAMTDAHWRARHRDYAATGIRDVWFWGSLARTPHVVFDESMPVWTLANPAGEGIVTTFIGRPHTRRGSWWQQPELRVYAPHHPPCVGDATDARRLPLAELTLDTRGVLLPADVRTELAQARDAVAVEAAGVRDRRARETEARRTRIRAAPPRGRTSKPSPPPPAESLLCVVCRTRLDPTLARTMRHLLC